MGGQWDKRLGGPNAFDAVRLVLASLVVFEHAFFLLDNSPAREPLHRLTGGQVHSGELAVYMFFAISGFLVARSRLASSLPDYSVKRFLRIVPGFLVATVVGILLVGPQAGQPDYQSAQNWPSLILTTLALKQANPVATLLDNPLSLVHGTLWSIRYEVDCYILIAILGSFGLLAGRRAAVTFTLVAAVLMTLIFIPLPKIDHGPAYLLISSPDRWGKLFAFFFAGAALFIWRARIPMTPWLLAASLVWIAVSAVVGGLYWALLFGGTYAALYIALSFAFEPRLGGRKIDLSYGLYLYGWPVEQLIIHYADPSPWLLFAIALPLTAVVALLSWELVEQPALRLARRRAIAAIPATT